MDSQTSKQRKNIQELLNWTTIEQFLTCYQKSDFDKILENVICKTSDTVFSKIRPLSAHTWYYTQHNTNKTVFDDKPGDLENMLCYFDKLLMLLTDEIKGNIVITRNCLENASYT
jgi:hypothetical protein